MLLFDCISIVPLSLYIYSGEDDTNPDPNLITYDTNIFKYCLLLFVFKTLKILN